MPFAGCSIGDLIALVNLVLDVTRALNESVGAPAEYQQATREVTSLANVLLALEKVVQYAEKVDPSVHSFLADMIYDCYVLLGQFRDGVVKYKLLSTAGENRGWRYMMKSLRWTFSEKKQLASIREALATRKQDIVIILLCLSPLTRA